MPATSFSDLPSGGVGRQGPFFGVFAGRPCFPPIFWTIAGLPRVSVSGDVSEDDSTINASPPLPFTAEIWPPGWRMGKGWRHKPARPTLIGGVH